MTKNTKGVLAIIATILIVVVFFYVWPGVWRYTYYERGLARLDRLTGKLYTRQIPKFNPVWSTLEKDLQNKRDGGYAKPAETNGKDVEILSALKEAKGDRLAAAFIMAAEERMKEQQTLEEGYRHEGMTIGDVLDEMDSAADSFSTDCREAIQFAFEKGYSIEDVSSARPNWSYRGVEGLYSRYESYKALHPGRRLCDDYTLSLRQNWVPIKRS